MTGVTDHREESLTTWSRARHRSWSQRLGPHLLLAGSLMFGVPALGIAIGELARPDDAPAAAEPDDELRLAELTASR